MFCKSDIKQDRYCISLGLERQDFPLETKWQKNTEVYLENVCSKCEQKIVDNFRSFIRTL